MSNSPREALREWVHNCAIHVVPFFRPSDSLTLAANRWRIGSHGSPPKPHYNPEKLGFSSARPIPGPRGPSPPIPSHDRRLSFSLVSLGISLPSPDPATAVSLAPSSLPPHPSSSRARPGEGGAMPLLPRARQWPI